MIGVLLCLAVGFILGVCATVIGIVIASDLDEQRSKRGADFYCKEEKQ